PVLHDVSFTVPAGRTVALVGPTGAGKSTIAALAARLIDPGSGAVRLDGIDDEAVWAALRAAQADGFVAKLDDQLDTEVGERGVSLSGGQRQRLTIARALAGRPRLLVLDDATSAVDPRVEAAILAELRRADRGASVLVVAYRRATIALAD